MKLSNSILILCVFPVLRKGYTTTTVANSQLDHNIFKHVQEVIFADSVLFEKDRPDKMGLSILPTRLALANLVQVSV